MLMLTFIGSTWAANLIDVSNSVNIELAPECKIHDVPFYSEFDFWGPPTGPNELGIIDVIVYGTGKATHMGLTNMVVNEIVDTNVFCNCAWNGEAEVFLTAANGDELHFNYSSIIDPSALEATGDLNIIGHCTVTGGTGRFTNASGVMTYKGVYNVITFTGTAIFDGSIKY